MYAEPRGMAYWIGALAPREWYGLWGAPLIGREQQWENTECVMGRIANCEPYKEWDYYVADVPVVSPVLALIYQNSEVWVYRYVN